MSRAAQPRAAPVAKRPAGGEAVDGELHLHLSSLHVTNPATSETCPVCKSSRYLNSNLRFLVNPECYHKMCESCVDRIFSHGPANCPIPGCKKTLRKHRFREQTFEDIRVEREVDIRKRIAQVFNKREEDFEDLRAYNDYLNEVEDITFNLVERIDVEATERRLENYRKQHVDEIKANQSLAEDESLSYAALQKEEEKQAKARRAAARREEEEERREIAENRRDMLARLASGTEDAETIAREGQQVQLKRRLDRQAAAERQRKLQSTSNGSSDLVIKGLKSRKQPEPEAPIDSFGGLSFEGMQYYSVQGDYVWDALKVRPDMRAGGYDAFEQFGGRALCEAFSGLGVFVADEVTAREQARQDDQAQGTKRAEIGAKDVKMEDPF